MKKLLFLPVLYFAIQTSAQSEWTQSLHYNFHIVFHPGDKSIDALMKLQYVNHSPDTISYIWFHVWPNAFRNDRTRYTDQSIENGDTRFYFSSKEQKGYLNRLDFRVDGVLARVEGHPEYIEVVKLILPKPLLPGDSISISSSFHLRLPFNFNGYGYGPHHFEMRNWYPEPAVYDGHGWHPMPFLLQGGAYHEAADYDVDIEAPAAYRIAAGAVADTISHSASGNLYHFSIQHANSFAWIADSRYLVKTDSIHDGSGAQTAIQYFYTPGNAANYKNVMDAAKKEIALLSAWFVPYPHQAISIVPGSSMQDQSFSGLVCTGDFKHGDSWRQSLRMEILAQWFQTILMTNQRDLPWFSKGFISFYDQRISELLSNTVQSPGNNLWLHVAEKEKTVQPIATVAPALNAQNDSLIPEIKAALWLRILSDSIETSAFDQNMQNYFYRWKFKHPYPINFMAGVDSFTEKNTDPLFNKLSGNESLFNSPEKRITKPVFIASFKNTERYNYIGIAPVLGYNRYDGFMLGAVIHNVSLPENNFEFLFTPMYAFGSKTIEGLGRLSYFWQPDRHYSRITVGINGERFDSNKATDSTGIAIFEGYSKLVPYIRVDFKSSGPRSTISKWMDLKSYLITETSFGQFAVSSKDSLIHPNATSSSFRYVNQLSFNFQDARVLYPYGFRAEFQQAQTFYRINLHANYFLNYPDGGGFQVRFFAAKFGVWNANNVGLVTRYEPKLLGVTGSEDYLYEDYFIGRSSSNALENTSLPNGGVLAQQIMNRDGGLKLRIDSYDYLQGRSANWVSAFNFTSTLPAGLFPFPLPIRIFFDLGTYAEAWENNPPTSRFLYTGGIQLSLFKNLLNIYAPLVYSSDFKDALGTTSFGKKITFSIDIQNIDYKKHIANFARYE